MCSKTNAAVTSVQEGEAKVAAVRLDVAEAKAKLSARISELKRRALLPEGVARTNVVERLRSLMGREQQRSPQLEARISRFEAKLPALEAKLQGLLAQMRAQLPQVQASVPPLQVSPSNLAPWLQNLLPQIQAFLPQLQAMLPQIEARITEMIPQLDAWIQGWCSAGTAP